MITNTMLTATELGNIGSDIRNYLIDNVFYNDENFEPGTIISDRNASPQTIEIKYMATDIDDNKVKSYSIYLDVRIKQTLDANIENNIEFIQTTNTAYNNSLKVFDNYGVEIVGP